MSKEEIKEVTNEAPESLHIDAYYKGYHVGLTKRASDAKLKPYIDSAMEMIDYLISKEWKPSWNEDTNQALTKKTFVAQPVASQPYAKSNVDQATCKHLHVTMKQSSGHNKPENKGKFYNTCLDCNKFMGWADEGKPAEEFPERQFKEDF